MDIDGHRTRKFASVLLPRPRGISTWEMCARRCLTGCLRAKTAGPSFCRIEDTDLERSEARYETQLIEDLKWLGLDWDEGPDVGGPYPPYRQSDKMDVYRSYAERLIKERKAYYCFCTAEELERDRQQAMAEQRQPNYSGKCRNIDPAEAERRRAAGESGGYTAADSGAPDPLP